MSDAISRELNKLATEHYDRALESRDHFTVAEVADGLAVDLLGRFSEDHSITRDLIAMTAHSLARKVDQARILPADPAPSLFDDMDRPVPVAGSRRIARRHMRQDDWSEHLENVSGNAARVNAAASREYARHSALSPYLAEGLTTEAAAERWQADNPDKVLS